jgi:hypothetical protein
MNNANLYESYLLESAIAKLFTHASQKGKITLTDCRSLVAARLTYSLSEAEKDLINRLLYAIRRGRLKVVID